MCPKPNDTQADLIKNSNVGDFKEGIPALFTVLTEMPDPHHRWDAKTFPIDIEYNHYVPKKEIKIKLRKYLIDFFFLFSIEEISSFVYIMLFILFKIKNVS